MSSQFVTTSAKRRPLSALPYAFTENGIAMLSGVLRSQQAININIQIMRAFNAMRHFIGSQAQVFQRIEVLERTQLSLVAFKEETNRNFEEVFRRLDDNSEKPEKGIFYDGQIFDAYSFINERIREAKKRIVLIDNYVDLSVLERLAKKNIGVAVTIYTTPQTRLTAQDVQQFNAQYPPLDLKFTTSMHDRFLIIDNSTLYHIGASLKDLGKRCFAFDLFDSSFIPDILAKL
jgi:hypothetical protein